MSIRYLEKNKAQLIVSFGTGTNRRRITKTVRYTGKKDLKRQHDEFEQEVRAGFSPSALTVPALVKWHIETQQALGIKATTLRGYNACHKRINSAFKGIKADSLTTYQVEKWVAQNANKSLAPKTIKNTISVLSAAYKHAIKDGMLTSNPCERVELPKASRKEIETLTPDEITAFCKALDAEPLDFKVACELALFCGLRRSEVCGITESKLDCAQWLLTIDETRHEVNGKDVIQTPKTAKSRRVIAIPELIQADIIELKKAHKKNAVKSAYLIQNEFGEPVRPQYLTMHLQRCLNNNKLKHVTYHGLRHSYASMLHNYGVDLAQISAQLGHSTINTTAGIYLHVFEGQNASTRAIADLVTKKGAK